MKEHYELAELLIASWKLANGEERMPTSHGILDRALQDMVGDLPDWAKENLNFVDTRVGLRCIELPAVLDCAQESFLTSEPNYTYLRTEIKVDAEVCERMLEDLEVDTDVAKEWGARLKEKVDGLVIEDKAKPMIIEAA